MSERYEYTRASLTEADLSPSPILQLYRWLEDAVAERVVEPTAACLSTVSVDGLPSSRMVLLRGVEESGITFFTNYLSRKGREISDNPSVCLNLWWARLERQVRVEGKVSIVSHEMSDEYWRERPRESQLASAASPQSEPIGDRQSLLERIGELAAQFPADVPRPEHWGGYRLAPDYFEFWQGGISRLHDRLEYRLRNGIWTIQRLAP